MIEITADIRAKLDAIKAQLVALQESIDLEVSHDGADALICEALRLLGQDEIVDAYNKTGKWYA